MYNVRQKNGGWLYSKGGFVPRLEGGDRTMKFKSLGAGREIDLAGNIDDAAKVSRPLAHLLKKAFEKASDKNGNPLSQHRLQAILGARGQVKVAAELAARHYSVSYGQLCHALKTFEQLSRVHGFDPKDDNGKVMKGEAQRNFWRTFARYAGV